MLGLTPQQQIFCDEYLIDFNGTRAYLTAYPNVKTETVAASLASRLLTIEKVAAYIKRGRREAAIMAGVTKEMILQELASMAFSDVTDIVKIKGRRVSIENTDDLTPMQRKAISGIKKGRNGIELTLYGKDKALDLLGKHLGMWDQSKNLQIPEGYGVVMLPPVLYDDTTPDETDEPEEEPK